MNVYRALAPWKRYVRSDGTVSDAAFKDSNGLSVEKQCDRIDNDVINHMQSYLKGNITKIPCSVCVMSNISIENPPSKNQYHRLLLNKNRRDLNDLCLTDEQASDLADNAQLLT